VGSYRQEALVAAPGLKPYRNDCVAQTNLDRAGIYDGKDFDNMYMTSFIQTLIDGEWKVKPALIHNGWVEVDTVEELDMYESMGMFKEDHS
jgi:choline kinase